MSPDSDVAATTPSNTDDLVLTQPFDYSQLPDTLALALKDRAQRIRTTYENAIIDMGRELAEAQEELAHHGSGTFGAWAQAELGLSKTSVYNLINVYDRYKVRPNFWTNLSLSRSALYLLAQPSTPDDVIEEIGQRVEAGETITHKDVKAAVSKATGPTAFQTKVGIAIANCLRRQGPLSFADLVRFAGYSKTNVKAALLHRPDIVTQKDADEATVYWFANEPVPADADDADDPEHPPHGIRPSASQLRAIGNSITLKLHMDGPQDLAALEATLKTHYPLPPGGFDGAVAELIGAGRIEADADDRFRLTRHEVLRRKLNTSLHYFKTAVLHRLGTDDLRDMLVIEHSDQNRKGMIELLERQLEAAEQAQSSDPDQGESPDAGPDDGHPATTQDSIPSPQAGEPGRGPEGPGETADPITSDAACQAADEDPDTLLARRIFRALQSGPKSLTELAKLLAVHPQDLMTITQRLTTSKPAQLYRIVMPGGGGVSRYALTPGAGQPSSQLPVGINGAGIPDSHNPEREAAHIAAAKLERAALDICEAVTRFTQINGVRALHALDADRLAEVEQLLEKVVSQVAAASHHATDLKAKVRTMAETGQPYDEVSTT
jgi:hypothetical protein